MDIEQQIRIRAYEIWMAAGRGDGHAERHWLEAERAVTQKRVAAAKSVRVKKPVAKAKLAASAKPAPSKSAKAAGETKATTPNRIRAAAARSGVEASI